MIQIQNLYNLLNEEQKKNFNRTVLGAGSDVVRETIELSRLVTNPDQQEIDETEKYLQNLYRAYAGVENVEMVKRGDREVAAIKEPESGALEFTRDIGAFVGSMVGVGKAAKPLQALGAVKKAQQVAPISTKVAQTVATGEVAAQLSINPYEETLAGVIGSMIKENDGLEGDIKKYLLDPLTSSQEKTELENRLALLGEGLGLTGAVALTGKALKASATPLLQTLNKIKNKGEKATTDFIDTMSGYKQLDAQQKKVALSKRKKDITEGKVVGEGDVKALDSKLDQPINLQFSQNDLLRGLNDFARRAFTPQGGRTELMHEKFLKTENTKEKWNATINHIAGNLNRAIAEVVSKTGRNKEGLLEQINKVAFSDYKNIKTAKARQAMFDSSLKSLPKEIQPFVRQMRETQDELSRLMTKTDYLTDEQKKLYQDNLGSYVRKSYRLYNQPGYKPDKSVAKDAKEYLKSEIRRNNSTLTDDEVILRAEAQYNDIIGNRKDVQNFNSSLERFDKIRREIFQGRKDIPTPIRNLLGEIDNPVEKFIHSTTKLSSAVEDLKFHKDIFNDGKNIYFYSNKTGIFNKQIPQGFGQLSGQYTTPELQRYFTVGKKLPFTEADNWGGVLWRNLTLLKGISQSSKTVWSHATHVKNIAGGFQMSLANGTNPLNPKRISETLNVLRAKKKPGEIQEFYEELSGRGILNKGVVAGDLRGLVSDLEGVAPNNVLLKILNSGINKKAQNLYIAEDDFFKINMYLGEQQYLKRLNDALPAGQRLSDEALKDEAARTVRDVLPNYDLVPELLKDLRRTPIFGRFFSFMAESVRISVNSLTRGVREVNQGKQLIGAGNSKAGGIQLERGLRRLSSFTAVAGGGALALEKGSQALSGLSQEEVEAAKKFLPDYMQNSRIFVTVTPEGEPAIGNISSWDAYDFPKKPLQVLVNRALSDEKYTEESFIKDVLNTTVNEMVSPFLGESIIQEQLSNYIIRGGRTLEGDLMVNPYDRTQRFEEGETYSEGLMNNLPILLSNIVKSIEPGTVSSISRYADTWDKEETKFNQDIYKEESLIKFLTGFGVQPLNKEYLENVYSFKVSDFAKKKSMRRNNLYRAIEPDMKAEDFINQYLDQNQKYYREFSKLHRLTEAAEMFDLPIFDLIQDSGFNRQDLATFIGKRRNFQPLGLTENLQLQILENSKSFDEFYDIVSDINEIDRQLSNLPVLIDDEIYKVMEEEESQPEQVFERLQKTAGGIVRGPAVPFTKENPADRINPLTGEPYQEEERVGFSLGGKVASFVAKNIGQPESVNESMLTQKFGKTYKSDALAEQMERLEKLATTRDPGGSTKFVSPSLKVMIERGPQNIKGPQVLDWLKANTNKGIRPDEVKELGIESYVIRNPEATLGEVVEAVSPRQTRLTKAIKDKDEVNEIDFETAIAEYDPIDNSPLWSSVRESIEDEIKDGQDYGLYSTKLMMRFGKEQHPDIVGDVSKLSDLSKEKQDDLIDEYARFMYKEDPYEIIRPKTENLGNTFALGNEDIGYTFFINGVRKDDLASVYSNNEATITLDRLIREDFGRDLDFNNETYRYKQYIDENLPGGENYREVVFELANAKVPSNASTHFDEPNYLAHALVRDRELEGNIKTLHIDELQSDLHSKAKDFGYATPENLGRLNSEIKNLDKKITKDKIDGLKDRLLKKYKNLIVENGKKGEARNFGDVDYVIDKFVEGLELNIQEQFSDQVKEFNKKIFNIQLDQNPFESLAFLNPDKLKSLSALRETESLYKDIKQFREDVISRVKFETELNYLLPDYPYKENWHTVVINRLLAEAIDEGYDAISLSPAKVLSDRYTDSYEEFYSNLYDKKVPSYLKKLARRYKGKFERGKIEYDYGVPNNQISLDNSEVNILRITPEMRELLEKEGLQAFNEGGLVSRLGFAEGGDVSFVDNILNAINPDARDTWYSFAEAVKNVESKGDYQAVQKGTPIARGAYQYETNYKYKDEDGETKQGSNAAKNAVNRLVNLFDQAEGNRPSYVGDILVRPQDVDIYNRARELKEIGYRDGIIDLSKESKEFQDALFLADKIFHPDAPLRDLLDKKISYEDFWLNYHWAGKEEDKEQKRQQFKRDNPKLK